MDILFVAIVILISLAILDILTFFGAFLSSAYLPYDERPEKVEIFCFYSLAIIGAIGLILCIIIGDKK